MWTRRVIMKAICSAFFILLFATGARWLAADEKNSIAKKEVRVEDLLALPTKEYRSEPYIKAAQSLQGLCGFDVWLGAVLLCWKS